MNDADAERAVNLALELGYRLVDTAEDYRNEVGVGRALRGVPRDEVFVTSKFNARWHSVEGPRVAFEASAEKLGVEYLDLAADPLAESAAGPIRRGVAWADRTPGGRAGAGHRYVQLQARASAAA
jgi:hypothetical protein